MTNEFDIILKSTTVSLSPIEQERMFKDFSRLLGWEPGDRVEPGIEMEDVTNGHLIVEHGLEQSAVITFLKSPAISLQPKQTQKLLSISYNSLIDWHIYVESDKVSFIFNRAYHPEPITRNISSTNLDSIKSSMFDQITGSAPNPNFPALDDALIETISYWKRNLAAELKGKPNRVDYSTLFNSIFFTRAVEDHAYKITGSASSILLELLHNLRDTNSNDVTLKLIIENSLNKLLKSKLPKVIIDLDKLEAFDDLSFEILYELFASFYKNTNIPYPYDFAIMSKHALSRIYEHYVSLLSFDEKDRQLYFFQPFPIEKHDKSYGSVYTPQFIARFFARFLREQYPPRIFRNIKTLDPACGSGIFLRTILEMQCAPSYDGLSSGEIDHIFSNIKGIDLDENATQATLIICQDFVGHALQDYLYGKRIENNFYSIYDVDQDLFKNTDWTKVLLPPSNLSLARKLENFKPLREFLSIKQGIITGADDLFIVPKLEVPKKDSKIWIPLLRDRDMLRYTVPKTPSYYVFYPAIAGKVLDEKELKEGFPQTWNYLLSQKNKIPARKLKDIIWWLPTRLRFRDEKKLGSPKIVTPNLVLTPRFSIDVIGKYLVSHSPYLVPMIPNPDPEFLKFFLAILNSTIGAWLISTHSDKYSRGYSRLEVKSLNSIPVPDPAKINPKILARLLHLVDKKLAGNIEQAIDSEIDELVAEVYDLNSSEKLVVGFEGYHA